MKRFQSFLLFIFLLFLSSCIKDNPDVFSGYTNYNYFTFDEIGEWSYTPSYLPSEDTSYRKYDPTLDVEVDTTTEESSSVLLFTINNQNTTEVFPYIHQKIEGLKANTIYEIDLKVDVKPMILGEEIEGNTSINVKVGVLNLEPINTDDNGTLKPNFEKTAAEGGTQVDLLAETILSADSIGFSTLSSSEVLQIETDENGMYWFWLGYETSMKGNQGLAIDELLIYYKEL